MKLAAMGNRGVTVDDHRASRFLTEASLRREFPSITPEEYRRLPPWKVRYYQAFIEGLGDAAEENARKQSR